MQTSFSISSLLTDSSSFPLSPLLCLYSAPPGQLCCLARRSRGYSSNRHWITCPVGMPGRNSHCDLSLGRSWEDQGGALGCTHCCRLSKHWPSDLAAHLLLSTPGAPLQSNPEKAPHPAYPKRTTSKLLHMDPSSEATQRWRIIKAKSEPYGLRSRQNKQNYSIRVGEKETGVWVSGSEPGFGGPQHGLGSLASPPRPQRPQTVLGAPGVLVLLTEDSE